MPKVVLERSTDISLVAKGARECYKSVGDDGGEKDIALLKKICSMGHNSVMEHAVFTFRISDVSRALSHQLVRHRISSYSQASQRFVKQNEPEYIKPHTVEEMGGYAEELYEDVMEVCWDAYNRLVAYGIPKEDARYVLPNATKTSLVMTINFNSLRNFMLHRLDKSAQWEIRELASDMFYALPPIYREILEQSYNIHPSTL